MFTSFTFQSASLHLSHRYAPRWLSTISCPTCTRGIIIVNCWIMVIEVSGVQFCLKSHAGFQNRMSKLPKFDLKSQVWFQEKIIQHEVQLPLNITASLTSQNSVSTDSLIKLVANLLKRGSMKRLLQLRNEAM